MPEKTQLFIADPCHEQWGNMQPDADGRFCGSCQKTVVDFTMMSDQEVLSWFSGAGKSVCGRFMEDQLNRDLSPVRSPKKSPWAIWQFLLAGLLVSSEVSAQEKPLRPPVSQTGKRTDDETIVVAGMIGRRIPPRSSYTTIRIIDAATGHPVPGASLRVGKAYFSADTAGQVTIAGEKLLQANTLEITSVGYAKKTVAIDRNWVNAGVQTISLAMSANILGDVTVVQSSCRTKMGGAMAVRIERFTLKDTLAFIGLGKKPLTVYPNPVARGASVTLSVQTGKPGNYLVQLFSNAGALMESMRIEGVDGPRTELLNVPASLAAGLYFVRLSHEQTGKVYTQKVVVM